MKGSRGDSPIGSTLCLRNGSATMLFGKDSESQVLEVHMPLPMVDSLKKKVLDRSLTC